jgi:hypothetical protein
MLHHPSHTRLTPDSDPSHTRTPMEDKRTLKEDKNKNSRKINEIGKDW